jgi:hypothetical protein
MVVFFLRQMYGCVWEESKLVLGFWEAMLSSCMTCIHPRRLTNCARSKIKLHKHEKNWFMDISNAIISSDTCLIHLQKQKTIIGNNQISLENWISLRVVSSARLCNFKGILKSTDHLKHKSHMRITCVTICIHNLFKYPNIIWLDPGGWGPSP